MKNIPDRQASPPPPEVERIFAEIAAGEYRRTPELLYIIVKLQERPNTDVLGVKEDLATYCERFGDIKLIDVCQTNRPMAEQIKMMEEAR